jgi:hypothetical protein
MARLVNAAVDRQTSASRDQVPTAVLVAIDNGGNVLTTKIPLAGAKGWKRSHLDKALTALACPPTALCVAVDSNGYVLNVQEAGGRGEDVEQDAGRHRLMA